MYGAFSAELKKIDIRSIGQVKNLKRRERGELLLGLLLCDLCASAFLNLIPKFIEMINAVLFYYIRAKARERETLIVDNDLDRWANLD
jgi:hypothetical protein